MAKSDDTDHGLVQSVTRAFDVLFAVAAADKPPTVGMLSKLLALPRPTVHRILNTLVASGVVSRIDTDKGYVITSKLVLATANSERASLGTIAPSYLHRLVALGEETASVHVRTGDLRTCIAEVQGSRDVRFVRGPGWTGPIWSGAVGRVLLSGMPDHEVGEIFARNEPHKLATNTVLDVDDTRRLIDADRKRGWSSSESETIDGAAAVAAPIVDNSGGTVAALSLYAPADRLSHMMNMVEDLQIVAREMGRHWSGISTIDHVRLPQDLQRAN
jgi:DNA-binding IclR family transcriptional regulator